MLLQTVQYTLLTGTLMTGSFNRNTDNSAVSSLQKTCYNVRATQSKVGVSFVCTTVEEINISLLLLTCSNFHFHMNLCWHIKYTYMPRKFISHATSGTHAISSQSLCVFCISWPGQVSIFLYCTT